MVALIPPKRIGKILTQEDWENSSFEINQKQIIDANLYDRHTNIMLESNPQQRDKDHKCNIHSTQIKSDVCNVADIHFNLVTTDSKYTY